MRVEVSYKNSYVKGYGENEGSGARAYNEFNGRSGAENGKLL